MEFQLQILLLFWISVIAAHAGKYDDHLPVLRPATDRHNKTHHKSFRTHESKTVTMKGGEFTIGVKDPKSITGEYPPRKVRLEPFEMDKFPVTVGDWLAFLRFKPGYQTVAEKAGWSWVFLEHISEFAIKNMDREHHEGPWFTAVQNAYWRKPFGLKDQTDKFFFSPVTHVSYKDAIAYCHYMGKRLPTEKEWEYAARGGKKGERYPWGERFEKNRMNVWQGNFPTQNRKIDSWDGVSPVKAYPAQNDFKMFDMVGNAWEWTSTLFSFPKLDPKMPKPVNKPIYKPRNGTLWYTLKGGSFLDSKDGTINLEARCAARTLYHEDYHAENVGFRCAKTIDKKYIDEPPLSIGAVPHSHKGLKKGEHHDMDPDGSFVKKVKDNLNRFVNMGKQDKFKKEL